MSEEPLPAEMPGRDPSGRFLPRNPPQRSAERQHLAALIERRDQLLAHAARLSDARERLNLRELEASRAQAAAALRKAEEQAPQDLEALVEPTTRGDPESPLRWTCKSVRRLAEALQQQGHQVSRTLVAELLNATDYSLQGNRKTKEGDRATQTGMRNSPISTPKWPLLWPNSSQ